ncbi:UNVERIFIED_CONTAM: hypothetical protein PYX00_008106 [Menopon gallinae]|uniref:Retinoid-inducible serine carboxypeptidase n=1 Tax=Menopon gallinae TaxID=328185 RepID=A0AAW2HLQ3_9NEOP
MSQRLNMSNLTKILLCLAIIGVAWGNPTPKKKGYGPGDQDWGWIKVRTGANMFYWLFYTTADVKSYYERPLVIWLQGGPGGSSTGYGNFAEVGPLHVNGTVRQHGWAKHVNLLFIDNPVGTGFSYVENKSYLTKDNIQIGKDMMVFLSEFYAKYPDFKKCPMYFFAESYGGKMAIEMAKQLDERVKAGKLDINFKGVSLIDAWIDPMDSVRGWVPLLMVTGLVDFRAAKRLSDTVMKIQSTIDKNQWVQATNMWRDLEMDILRETNGVDFYNILYKTGRVFLQESNLEKNIPDLYFDEMTEITKLMNGPVRNALKIPNNVIFGAQSSDVFSALSGDFMKPVTDVVEHVLNKTNIEVVIMTGELDLIVDTIGTLVWADKLKWKGSSAWLSSKRTPIVLQSIIEGYVTKVNTLSLYWINRSGHMVPKDNPEASLEVLKRVTRFDKK